MRVSGTIDVSKSVSGKGIQDPKVGGSVDTEITLQASVGGDRKLGGSVVRNSNLAGTFFIGTAQEGLLQEVTVKSSVDTFGVQPDPGFYGISKVIVETDPNLLASNIKKGVKIFDMTGTYGQFISKSDTITSNGQYSYTPGSYDGLSKVTVTVNVPQEITQVKVDADLRDLYVTPGYSDKIYNKEGATDFHGYDYVRVYGDTDLVAGNIKSGVTILVVTGTYESTIINEIQANFQSRSVTPTSFPYTVYPQDPYNALSSVTVNKDSNLVSGNIKNGVTIFGVRGNYEGDDLKLQDRTVTPTSFPHYVYPQSGYNGLSSVRVNADSNLVSKNIANGVTIFGVKGSYESKLQVGRAVAGHNGFTLVPNESGAKGFSEVYVSGDDNLVAENIKEGVTIFGVTGTCVENKIDFSKPTACLYNGLGFPELPADEYSNAVIHRELFALFLDKSATVVDGNMVRTTDTVTARRYNMVNGEWQYYATYTWPTGTGITFTTNFWWTSFDIPKNDGSPGIVTTAPIPVYTENQDVQSALTVPILSEEE